MFFATASSGTNLAPPITDSNPFGLPENATSSPDGAPSAHPLTFSQLFTPSRQEEQRQHFLAIANALHSRKEAHALASICDATVSISRESIAAEKQRRLFHLVCRLGALDPKFPQENLFQIVEEACQHQTTPEEICTNIGITILQPGQRLISKFQRQERQLLSCNVPVEKTHINDALQALEQLLIRPPEEIEDLEDTNLAILKNLRSLYTSPLYLAFCATSEHPLIDILHTVAIEQYTNTALKPAFEILGRQLAETHRPLPDRIRTICNRMTGFGITDSIHSSLHHYSFRLICTRFIPFILRKIMQMFSLYFPGSKMSDERSLLRNSPGALIDEIQATRTMQQRRIRTIMLAAPTVDCDATPEFRATLQALENNQFSPSETPYNTWAYTNLQNLSSSFEHASTLALMSLQDEYPLSFQSITLNQLLPQSHSDTFSQDEVAYHLSLIFNQHSSSLEGRGTSTDAGYYFSETFLKDHRLEIEHIAQNAFLAIQSAHGAQTPSKLKNAYIRLFHLGLTRLHETVAFDRTERRTHSPRPAIRSTICASCVDRGGMMNTAYLHALDLEENHPFLTSGTLFARALFTHRRAPVGNFLENLTGLFEVVPRTGVHAFLSNISLGRLTSTSI